MPYGTGEPGSVKNPFRDHDDSRRYYPRITVNDVPRAGRYVNINLKNNIETGGTMPTITTLKLVLTNIEDGRVRATIESPDGGVYAEKADAQTAAGQAVKTYLALYPLTPAQLAPTVHRAEAGRWKYSRPVITSMLQEAVANDGRVKVEYEDAEGHETTRVVSPTSVNRDGTVYVYDHLRDMPRTLRIDRVKAIQEVH